MGRMVRLWSCNSGYTQGALLHPGYCVWLCSCKRTGRRQALEEISSAWLQLCTSGGGVGHDVGLWGEVSACPASICTFSPKSQQKVERFGPEQQCPLLSACFVQQALPQDEESRIGRTLCCSEVQGQRRGAEYLVLPAAAAKKDMKHALKPSSTGWPAMGRWCDFQPLPPPPPPPPGAAPPNFAAQCLRPCRGTMLAKMPHRWAALAVLLFCTVPCERAPRGAPCMPPPPRSADWALHKSDRSLRPPHHCLPACLRACRQAWHRTASPPTSMPRTSAPPSGGQAARSSSRRPRRCTPTAATSPTLSPPPAPPWAPASSASAARPSVPGMPPAAAAPPRRCRRR